MIGFGFQLYDVIFFLMFGLAFSVFLVTLLRGIGQWDRNNRAPRLTVPVKVVAKRTNISRHHHGTQHHHTSASTSYFVTFEVESGDRMELQMPGSKYGLIVEGDEGMLTFQGTRFLKFERQF